MKTHFMPNKSVHENTNESRMHNAFQCLSSNIKYASGDEDAVRDLIADLLHYADARGFCSAAILIDARNNWRVER